RTLIRQSSRSGASRMSVSIALTAFASADFRKTLKSVSVSRGSFMTLSDRESFAYRLVRGNGKQVTDTPDARGTTQFRCSEGEVVGDRKGWRSQSGRILC